MFNILKLVWKSFVGGDDYAKYCLVEKISQRIYPRLKLSDYGRIFLDDSEFAGRFRQFPIADGSRNYDRKYLLDQLIKLILHLDGDCAECGCFQGSSAFLIAQRSLSTSKELHLFDSFSGLSSPVEKDGLYWQKGDLSASLEVVKKNLQNFEKIRFYPGWIPTQFEKVSSRKFCFVHIDVDLYEPTLASLQFFYERMVSGGIILSDDYGFKTCPGAKAAFEEFFKNKAEPIISVPTGQAFIVKR